MNPEPLKGKYREHAHELWLKLDYPINDQRLGHEANEVLDDVKAAVEWYVIKIAEYKGPLNYAIVKNLIDEAFADVVGEEEMTKCCMCNDDATDEYFPSLDGWKNNKWPVCKKHFVGVQK